MTSLVDAIGQNRIYENQELANFIISLENRYQIKDEIHLFKDLVNFSKNASIPLHGWFKYREGYSHTLVRELLYRFPINLESEFVIDPFCGSGTTLVESGFNGLASLGLDVNPMSVSITNSKVKIYSREQLDQVKSYLDLLNQLDIKKIELSQYEDLKSYFKPENLNDLILIKHFITTIKEEIIKELFFAGFLSIIEEVSDRKRDGNGLKKSESKVLDVISFYILKMESIYADLLKSQVEKEGTAYFGSATNLSQFVNKFAKKHEKNPGIIIFSPPYANSFDYFESYKLELRLGGFIDHLGKDGLKDLRNMAIRSFVSASQETIEGDKYINLMAEEIEKAIPIKEERTGKKDVRTRKVPQMIRGYFYDMALVLQQCSLVLPSGKKCCIVVDQSSYLGKIVPTDLFLGYLSEQYGFSVREIIVCRRAKTSGQQLQHFPYLGETLRESIVVLEKL